MRNANDVYASLLDIVGASEAVQPSRVPIATAEEVLQYRIPRPIANNVARPRSLASLQDGLPLAVAASATVPRVPHRPDEHWRLGLGLVILVLLVILFCGYHADASSNFYLPAFFFTFVSVLAASRSPMTREVFGAVGAVAHKRILGHWLNLLARLRASRDRTARKLIVAVGAESMLRAEVVKVAPAAIPASAMPVGSVDVTRTSVLSTPRGLHAPVLSPVSSVSQRTPGLMVGSRTPSAAVARTSLLQ
jgi:hypothetical protein